MSTWYSANLTKFKHKIHYGAATGHTLCGSEYGLPTTLDPAAVTCQRCQKRLKERQAHERPHPLP